MKKFLLLILTLVCITSSMLFFGCSGTYYTLTYAKVDGVTYVSEVKTGAKVLDGYTVTFSISLDQAVVGEPAVYANDTLLTANADGKYSFKMKRDTEVKVTGVELQRKYSITFDKGVERISYTSPDGDAESGFEVIGGKTVNFSVNISSYYVQEGYEVIANTEILTPNADGTYTVVVNEDTVITVIDLVQEENFTNRVNGGAGTQANPYKISRPIDLFYMATLVNSDYYTGYNVAYYELVNDIDMGGEQLFIIGDQSVQSAFFGGDFNGNGYTISNFYIDDTYVNADAGVNIFVPYIGMFGYAAATTESAPHIYNLNLDNFEINVDAAEHQTMFAAGGILGAGIGANITACSVTNAKITGDADFGYFAYLGGIAGVHQSAYSTDEIRYYSTIRSCYSDIEISADSGYVYAAGGIAGCVMSYEEKTTAFVLNCYSNSTVYGAMNCGGITGRLENNASIIGCYATGEVEGYSPIAITGMPDNDIYAESYAGGIAGYADYNAVIMDCFTEVDVYATAISGDRYGHSGQIVATTNKAGDTVIDSRKATVLNSYDAKETSINNTFLKEEMHWHEADWAFNDSGYPTINMEESHKTFNVVIDYGEKTVKGESQDTVRIADIYIPMSYWQITYDENKENIMIPEYVTADDGSRSYGYFFDEELTEQVPYGYVPTRDITLYTGFADYSEVSGKYFLQLNRKGSDIYLELLSDGTLKFVDGARILESNYVYDGENIFLIYTSIARLFDFSDETLNENAQNYYFTYKANVNDGILKIWDNTFFTAGNELTAVKKVAQFNYGKFYDENGVKYQFNTDGSGFVGNEPITYVIDGNVISVKRQIGTTETYNVSADGNIEGLTAYDLFAGVWETKANYHHEYTFDGMGKWEKVSFVYSTAGVKEVIDSSNGNYEVVNGEISLDNGVTAFVNSDGFLEITTENNTQVYYRDNSFVGLWNYFNWEDNVELVFEGVDVNNQGKVSVIYASGAIYDGSYQMENGKLVIYTNDFVLASLEYNKANNTLAGTIYSAQRNVYIESSLFCLYDDFKGEWVSEIDGLEFIEFDGLGYYDLPGSQEGKYYAISGAVKINGRVVGGYTVNNTMVEGTFTFEGVEYSISYNIVENIIEIVTPNGQSVLMQYDAWRNVDLIDENGVVYDFDGRGNLSNGGTVKIGNDTANYTITEHGHIVIRGEGYAATISKDSQTGNYKYMASIDDVKQLYVKNVFTGEWLLSEKLDTMTIGNFGAEMTAEGMYLGKSVVYTLNTKDNVVMFNYNDRVMTLKALTSGALMLSVENNAYTNTVCMPVSEVDEIYGTYQKVDGNGSISFDGFGNNNYTANGTVIVKDGEGAVTLNVSYTITDGEVEIKSGWNTYYVLKETTSTNQEAYQIKGKYYVLVKADKLYGDVAFDENELKYEFDGAGTVKVSDGTEYSYVIDYQDTSVGLYAITLTDENGNEYSATVDYTNATKYILEFTATEQE